MQTDDDLSSQQVKNKLFAEFNKICDEELKINSNIKSLIIDVLRSGMERDFKTLFFLN